ncbi:hypothetical protein DITRI_Ditri03aG0187800 [Diplodiscus trichospermus]
MVQYLPSFGFRPVLVISSPSLVEECFTKNDIILANRHLLFASKLLNYDSTTTGAAPYGHHCCNLCRIAAIEIFLTSRLNMFLKVEMKSRLSELSFNMIMRMVSGKRYFGVEVDDFDEARQFQDIIKEALELSGEVYPGDFLPFCR